MKNEFSEVEKLTEDTVFKYLKTFMKEFDRNRDLTEAITKKINKLERYTFNKGFIEITGEEIIERMKSFRRKRIKLWKEILEKYNRNKDIYNIKLTDHFKPAKFQG